MLSVTIIILSQFLHITSNEIKSSGALLKASHFIFISLNKSIIFSSLLLIALTIIKIINERYQDVKAKDLLILDEPTDGFSQQQVNRMQEIFDTLNTAQMIIISHERTLDSFITDIFTFKKGNHQTKVVKEIVKRA